MGLGPVAYLIRLRLHRVRQALLGATPGSTTVSATALDWGFWHFGEFSSAYKDCFGELPSDTLRRVPEAGPGRHEAVLHAQAQTFQAARINLRFSDRPRSPRTSICAPSIRNSDLQGEHHDNIDRIPDPARPPRRTRQAAHRDAPARAHDSRHRPRHRGRIRRRTESGRAARGDRGHGAEARAEPPGRADGRFRVQRQRAAECRGRRHRGSRPPGARAAGADEHLGGDHELPHAPGRQPRQHPDLRAGGRRIHRRRVPQPPDLLRGRHVRYRARRDPARPAEHAVRQEHHRRRGRHVHQGAD